MEIVSREGGWAGRAIEEVAESRSKNEAKVGAIKEVVESRSENETKVTKVVTLFFYGGGRRGWWDDTAGCSG